MSGRHGVLLLQGNRVAVAAGFRQVAVVALIHRALAVERHRLGRSDDLTVDEEFTLGTHAEFLAGDAGEALDVVILRRLAVLVVESADIVRPEDERVAARRIHEVIGHAIHEEHIPREDVEVEHRLPGGRLLAGHQHRAERTILDAPVAGGLGEDHAPAVLILARKLQLGLLGKERAQQHRLKTEVGRHKYGLYRVTDLDLMLIGSTLPDTGAEDAVIDRPLTRAQAVFDLVVTVALHHDRDADFTGCFGRNDVSPGPLNLLEQSDGQTRDRLVGGTHLGGHAVVRGPHGVRRNLERLQEETADRAGYDGRHDHHLGVIAASGQRVDLAAVADEDLVEPINEYLDLCELDCTVLGRGANFVG